MASKVPPSLKAIGHYVKIANENASRDPVIYYWCLFHAVQAGMQIDKSSPDALNFLTSLLGTLETIKKQLGNNDAITSEVVAQAYIENVAMKLFDFADKKEKAGQIDKNLVHAFYTAGHMMDILSLFGEIDEPYASAKKYAKWKSTQIFGCLRDGTPYVPSTQEERPPSFDNTATHHSSSDTGNPFEHTYPGSTGDLQQPTSNYPPPLPPHPSSYGHPTPPPAAPARPSPPMQSHIDNNSEKVIGGPSFEEWEQARKFAKYAISAIDYEDVKSTADNLRKALAVLAKHDH
ncbi:unnamed protein product, partial [Mesorhabditis spiculigera]